MPVFCLAKALSSELRLRAVHCLRALNLQALRAFLLPGPAAEAADSTFSSPLSPFLHPLPPPSVLFTPCRPCGCATSETFETTKALPDRPMAAFRRWKRRGAAAVGEWC